MCALRRRRDPHTRASPCSIKAPTAAIFFESFSRCWRRIACEIARALPEQIRRLVLVGIPLFNDEEREGFARQPWPKPEAPDGSHIITEWQRSLQWRGPGQTMDMVTRGFTAKLMAGATAWWCARAAFSYRLADALATIEQPILGVNPKDDLWQITPRFRALRPRDTLTDMPDYGFGIFEVGGPDLLRPIRAFLDAGTTNPV